MPPVPRVLFVSKPVVPPFHDGTKCLVRDVSTRLERVQPLVMATPGAPALARPSDVPDARDVELVRPYRHAGRFSPALAENLRATAYLARARADVWHFVFAPNPRTSRVGRLLRALRRMPVVQTIASPPRSFTALDQLLFGDIIVAQSEWTRSHVLAGAKPTRRAKRCEGAEGRSPDLGEGRRVELIRPPVGPIASRSRDARAEIRLKLGIAPGAPVVVYPGDIELSGGAERVAAAVGPLAQTEAELVVVFAYRPKTPRAHDVARTLERRLPPKNVRFTDTLPDVLSLIEEAALVLFPVDDLWGKVDLPIVLLETMQLGVPIVVLDQGPLSELSGAVKLAPGDPGALVTNVRELLARPEHRLAVAAAQRDYVEREHAARVVARRYESLYLELAESAARRRA